MRRLVGCGVAMGVLGAAPGGAGAQLLVHESVDGLMAPAPPSPVVLRESPAVVLGPFVSRQINTDPATGFDLVNDAANESSIARSLTDPDAFIVGWRQFDSVFSNFRESGYAYTRDGGATWSGGLVLNDGTFGSDPVLVAGPDGEFYYNVLDGSLSTQIYRTFDNAASWDGPFPAGGGDKQWMAIDATDGPNRGTLYQYWSSAANVSVDGGETWSASSSCTRWGTMTVGPDGRCYAGGRSIVGVGVNAADPLGPPSITNLDPLPYSNPIAFSGIINPAGIEGQNNVAVNTAPGPHYNEVYALQSARQSTQPPSDAQDSTDVYFAYSTDLGDTFSDAVRVSDAEPGTSWQWFATVAVAPNGRIDAVWNDTRDDPGSDPVFNPTSSRLYASYSVDGGRTWAANFPVSPAFDHRLGYPNQNKMGDYITMVSDDVGAHVAYVATFTGGQDVYYLNIGGADCDANGVPDDMEIAAGEATDLDGDGVPDACACLADLNSDGVVNIDDVDAFVGAFLSGDPAADLNTDGTLNFDDIDLFVASFLLGCG